MEPLLLPDEPSENVWTALLTARHHSRLLRVDEVSCQQAECRSTPANPDPLVGESATPSINARCLP